MPTTCAKTSSTNADIKNPLFIPAVSIFPTVNCKNIDAVKRDMIGGMEEALRHLKENGHTKIGFAGEPYTAAELENFKQAMTKVTVSSDFVIRKSTGPNNYA